MKFTEIHFIREVLVRDPRGNEIPTMQISEANAACLHPKFREVAFYQGDAVRTLYRELGGSRAQGGRVGSTVVLPNRSGTARLWRLQPEQVQVIPPPEQAREPESDRRARQDRARVLIQRMRS